MEGCVVVGRRDAERAVRLLRGRGLLDGSRRPARMDGEVAFPVVSAEQALRALAEAGLEARPCPEGLRLEERRRPVRLTGPVKSYTVIADFAVISRSHGVPDEAYREAAERILEMHPRLRAVYLKTETSGPLRLPVLELLAGSGPPRGVHREYGIRMLVDLEKAYFNPRLSEERRRVALLVGDGERVLDMFTGVGPFALHIAVLHRATVVANDINPHAVALLAENIVLNRRRLRGCIVPVRSDARLLPLILAGGYDRIIMNNPTMTPSFLPQACALASQKAVIHYYRLSASCEEAWGEMLEILGGLGCQARLERCRPVIDYSPRLSVHSLDVVVRRGG